MKRSWRALFGRRTKVWFLIAVFSATVGAVVEYANAAFIQVFLAHIGVIDTTKIPQELAKYSNEDTLVIISVFIGLTLIKAVAAFFSTLSPYVFSYMLNARLRFMTVFEILVAQKQKWMPASEMHTLFGEVYPKAGQFVLQISMLVVSVVQLLLLLGGMLYIGWKETLLGVAGLSIVGYVVKSLNRKVLSNAKSIPEEQLRMSQSIERVTRNWLLVKISGTQKKEYNFLVHRISDYFVHSTLSILFSILNANIPSIFGALLIAVILLTSKGIFHTSGASMLAFFYLFFRFVQNLGPAVGAASQALIYWPQYKASHEVYEGVEAAEVTASLLPGENLQVFKKTVQLPIVEDKTNNSQAHPAPKIDISDLDFQWGENKVFQNFSLSVTPGKILGITGPSGSGKSTLLQLIMGVIEPRQGQIQIDGIKPSEFLKKYSQNIGYVGADPFLFDGSLRDNLCYGLPFQPSEQQIRTALEQAQLLEFVEKTAGGLGYTINENGEGLSSGQKQRLSLARAFLRKPTFLILDEASANLDLKTEEEIERAIAAFKGKATILIVSHREGLVKSADQRLNLSPQV